MIEEIGEGWSVSDWGGNISRYEFKWKDGVKVVIEVWICFMPIAEVIVVLFFFKFLQLTEI